MTWIAKLMTNPYVLLFLVGLWSASLLWAYGKGKAVCNAENARQENIAQKQAQNKAVERLKQNEQEQREIIKYIRTKPRNDNPILDGFGDTLIRMRNEGEGNNSQ